MDPFEKSLEEEIETLDAAIDRFAMAMKVKLHEKAEEGWEGWDDLPLMECQDRAMRHLVRILRGDDPEQDVDVANFMAFHFFARTSAVVEA